MQATSEAPPHLPGFPEAKKEEWRKIYASALGDAVLDFPEDALAQRMAARRQANKLFRVPELTSYEQALALENWQVIHRAEDEVEGKRVLKIVTIDAKGYSFPVPEAASNR